MIPCICLDDKDRPREVPPSLWVKEGEEYHITYFAICLPQRVEGVSLYEKPLNGTGPYEYFKGSRFGIRPEHWYK